MSTDGKVTPELVDAYLAYGRTEAEEHFWAFDAVVDLVQASPREGLTLVRELLSRPLEPDLLFYVAAGPLEDLLACHGREVVDEVLDLARRDPQARKALLQGVWGRSRIPRDVQEKLVAFAERVRPR